MDWTTMNFIVQPRANHRTQRTPESRCLHITPATRAAGAERHASMRRLALVTILGLSSLMLLGCPSRWKVVFINGADEQVSVTVSGSLDGAKRSFRLESGHSRSELAPHVQMLQVFDSSGEILFERDDFGSKDLAPPAQGKYPHIYVLLTTTNAYLVPPDYAKSWRQHIDEITKTRA